MSAASPLPRSVRVSASGRLHLGFLDPAATLGRRFGSLGVMVAGPATEVVLTASDTRDRCTADGPEAQAELPRAIAHLHAMRARTGLPAPLHLHLARVLPAHAGFGSGTQLALAVGRAFTAWHRLALPTATLAHGLGRGLRSGIGIAGFDQGGLLLDGGPGSDGTPAPVLARLAVPDAWRVLLVQDPTRRGLSGTEERAALARLAPLSQAQAAEICHHVLMQVLPGAAGRDFVAFAHGVSRVQQVLGEHFAPAQDGEPYTSAAVGALMRWLAAHTPGLIGAPAGIGQSSWGPTAFAVLPSALAADTVVQAAQAAGVIAPALQLAVVRANNHGAEVVDSHHPAAAPSARHASAESLWRWALPGPSAWQPH